VKPALDAEKAKFPRLGFVPPLNCVDAWKAESMREAVSHEKFWRTPCVGVENLRAVANAHDRCAPGNIGVLI
jgi:hypothetical protein